MNTALAMDEFHNMDVCVCTSFHKNNTEKYDLNVLTSVLKLSSS